MTFRPRSGIPPDMPRPPRIESSGAWYHVANRARRGARLFADDADRGRFLGALAETAGKTGWRVQAWCLLPEAFEFVIHTPHPNLVAGMRWLSGVYTWGVNRRHGTRGHLFARRYRAVLIEPTANWLREACDHVHLAPVLAGRIEPDVPLPRYAWSSLRACLDPAEPLPPWLDIRVALTGDPAGPVTLAARRDCEQRLASRRVEDDPSQWRRLTRGWCFGGPEFKRRMIERATDDAVPMRAGGPLCLAPHEAAAEAVIAEELHALGWRQEDLPKQPKTAPEKVRIAARLRRETVVTLAWVARRLHMGSVHTLRNCLARFRRETGVEPVRAPEPVVPPKPPEPAEPEEEFDVTWD